MKRKRSDALYLGDHGLMREILSDFQRRDLHAGFLYQMPVLHTQKSVFMKISVIVFKRQSCLAGEIYDLFGSESDRIADSSERSVYIPVCEIIVGIGPGSAYIIIVKELLPEALGMNYETVIMDYAREIRMDMIAEFIEHLIVEIIYGPQLARMLIPDVTGQINGLKVAYENGIAEIDTAHRILHGLNGLIYVHARHCDQCNIL